MKKNRLLKGLTFISVLIIAFILGIVSVKAYEYIVWRGTPQAQNMDSNLDRVQIIIGEKNDIIKKLENELSEHDGDVEYYENYVNKLVKEIELRDKLILERDKSIIDLQEDVLSRDKIIEELRVILEQVELENEQAYEDIKMLDSKLERILEEVE